MHSSSIESACQGEACERLSRPVFSDKVSSMRFMLALQSRVVVSQTSRSLLGGWEEGDGFATPASLLSPTEGAACTPGFS
jgi:hypothetical protein